MSNITCGFSIEHEIANHEFIRAIKHIHGKHAITFHLTSIECLLNKNVYNHVLDIVSQLLQKENYSVIRIGHQLLIFDSDVDVHESNIQFVNDGFIDSLPISSSYLQSLHDLHEDYSKDRRSK